MRCLDKLLAIAVEVAITKVIKKKEYYIRFIRKLVGAASEGRHRKHCS